MESINVVVEDLGKLKRKIIVTVPQDVVDKAYDKTYQSLKNTININGFRKGKLPQTYVEKRFNKMMKNEAIETLVPEYFEKAIKQEDIKPAIRPTFDDLDIDKKKPLVFSASFEIYPDFDLPESAVYGLEKSEITFTDEEIQEQKQRHLDNSATFVEKDGKADSDDQVTIDFEGKVDGESIAESKDHKYIIGSKNFLPEFEDALIGMSKEEEKSFDLTFPTDYNEENLRGKSAAFTVKVNEVSVKHPPEIDEKFLGKYGDHVKTEEDFTKYVEDEVRFRKEHEVKADSRTIIKDKLAEVLDFEIPEQLLEEEVSAKLNQAKQSQGQSQEDTSDEELETKAKEDALKELRFSIFVQKILDDGDVKPDESVVHKRFEMNCAMMGIRPEDLMKEEYGKHIYQQTYGMVMEEAVLDFITNKALEE